MVAEGQIGYVFEDDKNQSEKAARHVMLNPDQDHKNRTESHVTITEQKSFA